MSGWAVNYRCRICMQKPVIAHGISCRLKEQECDLERPSTPNMRAESIAIIETEKPQKENWHTKLEIQRNDSKTKTMWRKETILTWVPSCQHHLLPPFPLALPNRNTDHRLLPRLLVLEHFDEDFVPPICPFIANEFVPEQGGVVGILVAMGMHYLTEEVFFEEGGIAEVRDGEMVGEEGGAEHYDRVIRN